ncbi:MAG: 30S ribosomal protein S16 [Bacteroidales bacterium]|nr:30S ribosomal protein S16 [Candidatus Liminaster caballi]
MATKIRLARHGHKDYAFYSIVVADSRAPRDGKYIEKIGTYNPNTNPATIDVNFERALYWVETGAQPTLTAEKILSYVGVLLMKHLKGGIKKGALTEEQAQAKFDAWKAAKQAKIATKVSGLAEAAKKAAVAAAEAEVAVKNAKAEALAAKKAELAAKAAEEAAAKAAEEAAAATEEAPAEA